MKERSIKKIVVYKERDYNGDIGDIQFWEHSEENLSTRVSLGFGGDAREMTGGLDLGEFRFNKKNVTPKMAKKIFKLIQTALNTQSNPKVGVKIISN